MNFVHKPWSIPSKISIQSTLKHVIATLISLTISGVAIWQGMQILAIISFTVAIGLLYRNTTRRFYSLLLGMLRNAKQAKIGNYFEVVLHDGTIVPIRETDNLPLWGRILLSQLTIEEVGTLIYLSQKPHEMPIVVGMQEIYRKLRNKGLVEHDASTLHRSTTIRLSNELSSLLVGDSNF